MLKRLGSVTLDDIYNSCVYIAHPEYNEENGEPDRCLSCSFSSVCACLPEELPDLNGVIDIPVEKPDESPEELNVDVPSADTINGREVFNNCTIQHVEIHNSEVNNYGS